MARIFIDVNLFGERWFSSVLEELKGNGNVRFVYSAVDKLKGEHKDKVKALQFYKLMGEKRRRDDVDPVECQKTMDKLTGVKEWRGSTDCDDPRIFAMVFHKPTPFVFSQDKRMATCRGCIRGR